MVAKTKLVFAILWTFQQHRSSLGFGSACKFSSFFFVDVWTSTIKIVWLDAQHPEGFAKP
ncbi:MAG: hypothetical protein P3M75_00235 [Candidatus Hodgkinia cicadicola]|nr:MAG: hypothetical protein P3M75_00235 [Candidatus Hodgkinia cicadicola]